LSRLAHFSDECYKEIAFSARNFRIFTANNSRGNTSMRHRILVLLAPVVSMWLGGCATVDTTPKLDLDRANADELFKAERAHLTQRPKIGLALAGGGTRAALYAHGVLYGLNEAKWSWS
jgi:hypothetical protein